MSQKNILIIPARGGSKRIPGKNVKKFGGKPIIAYSISCALKTHYFDEVMVSTDDQKIAKMSQKLGAKVPFLRSAESANHQASLENVVLEVLGEYAKLGKTFDNFCCLLATAPFISPDDIIKAMKILLKSTDNYSVFTVVRYNYPIQRALEIKNGWLKMRWPENINKRSQDLGFFYHDAGQFYCLKIKEFEREQQFFSEKSKPIVLPETKVQDIDTIEDWQIAEAKYFTLKKSQK